MNDPETAENCPKCMREPRSEPSPTCIVCGGLGRVSASVASRFRELKSSFRRRVSDQGIAAEVPCPRCAPCMLCKGKKRVLLSEAIAWNNSQRHVRDTDAPPARDEDT